MNTDDINCLFKLAAEENERKERIRADYVKRLDAIGSGDTELDHVEADRLLCLYLRHMGEDPVADAWLAARDRCGFWFA